MHVLRVAGIDNGNRIALNGVSVIPLVSIGHVVARPSTDSGTTTRQRPLYGIDSKESITHVTLHVFVRIGMAVLIGHIPIERSNL